MLAVLDTPDQREYGMQELIIRRENVIVVYTTSYSTTVCPETASKMYDLKSGEISAVTHYDIHAYGTYAVQYICTSDELHFQKIFLISPFEIMFTNNENVFSQ